ncbi:MAG: potassium-transporting ATPase subunit B, partial [Actinomycetota bacterium]
MNTHRSPGFFNSQIILPALRESLVKLNPKLLVRNPVIFIVGIGALITSVTVVSDLLRGETSSFNIRIAIWLWFTVLFANFSEAMAESRGKAQADSLR